MSFKQIVEEIMASHHSLLKRELPRITALMSELANENPDSPQIAEARQIFEKVRGKVETHLRDEEFVLFPTGIALETGVTPAATELNLLERVAEMEKEHDGCGKTLNMIAQTITDVATPSATKETVLATIQLVQDDFVDHVEKENTKVHPLFIELFESSKAAR